MQFESLSTHQSFLQLALVAAAVLPLAGRIGDSVLSDA
jgi:hypothetical protein